MSAPVIIEGTNWGNGISVAPSLGAVEAPSPTALTAIGTEIGTEAA